METSGKVRALIAAGIVAATAGGITLVDRTIAPGLESPIVRNYNHGLDIEGIVAGKELTLTQLQLLHMLTQDSYTYTREAQLEVFSYLLERLNTGIISEGSIEIIEVRPRTEAVEILQRLDSDTNWESRLADISLTVKHSYMFGWAEGAEELSANFARTGGTFPQGDIALQELRPMTREIITEQVREVFNNDGFQVATIRLARVYDTDAKIADNYSDVQLELLSNGRVNLTLDVYLPDPSGAEYTGCGLYIAEDGRILESNLDCSGEVNARLRELLFAN